MVKRYHCRVAGIEAKQPTVIHILASEWDDLIGKMEALVKEWQAIKVNQDRFSDRQVHIIHGCAEDLNRLIEEARNER